MKGKLHQAYLTELNEVLYEIFDDQVLGDQPPAGHHRRGFYGRNEGMDLWLKSS